MSPWPQSEKWPGTLRRNSLVRMTQADGFPASAFAGREGGRCEGAHRARQKTGHAGFVSEVKNRRSEVLEIQSITEVL